MFSFEYVVLAASMLASAAVAGTVPHIDREAFAAPPPSVIPQRDVEVMGPRNLRARSSSLMKRDANASFDLDFQVQDQVLFDGPSLGLPIPLTLECVDCRTWGSVEAVTFVPDDIGDFFEDLTDFELFNNANLSIIFNGVGALVDLKVTAAQDGSFSLPLFATQTPLGVAGPNFQLGVVFSIDLVLGITGEVSAESGFELKIPDGAAFTMPLDLDLENTADFDGTTFNLLPLVIEAPANVSVALRLSVEAGIEFVGSPLLSAQALAGAFINIPEIIIGEELTLGGNDTCTLPVFAEININAGVFVDVGADIGAIDLGEFSPTLSTKFFEAAVSTCVDDILGGGVEATASATTSHPALPTAGDEPPCPVALVTETETTVSTVALTKCAVTGALNCPSDMAQVVLAERTQTLTSSSCPVVSANATASATASYVPTITASHTAPGSVVIMPSATSTPCETPTSAAQEMGIMGGYGVIALTKLATPVMSELVIDPAIAPPSVPTINAIPGGARYGNGTITTSSVARSMVTSPPA